MSLETFDWKGYLLYAGYPENEIPETVTDEELLQIRRHWAQTVYQEELAAAQNDPFLETPKERREYARDALLAIAPEFKSEFGIREPRSADRAFSAQEFRDWVVNNDYQDGNLDFYLKTFAASRINKNTKYEYPYLEGLSKKEFQDIFMEQNGIDPDYTSLEDIRAGNFGPAAMTRREEEESQLPRGSALRQGWLEFKKLTGLTTSTFGDFLGVEWMRNIGQGITDNAIKTIDEEGYRGKYQESLADTFKNQGIFAAAGKVLEMAQENWATTGVPLGLALMSAMFGFASRRPGLAARSLASARASLAAATTVEAAASTGAAATVGRVGTSTIAKALAFASAMSSGLEVGAVRDELEQKGKEEGRQLYDPNDPGDVVAWGLVAAALDHIGNMATFVGGGGLLRAAKGLVQSQEGRAVSAAAAAARQTLREMGKSYPRKIVEAMGVEGITEALQELSAIKVASDRGVNYDPKEIRDRMIDAGAVGAFMGGGMRSVQAIPETLRERAQRRRNTDTTQTPPDSQTPQTPNSVPQSPNEPPSSGFEGRLAWNTNYTQIDGGWAAWDGYNVGYGTTKEEASQALLDQSNTNKEEITATPTHTTDESRVSFGTSGELVVTGPNHESVIQRIIDLHNSSDNYINLDGTTTHTFDATALSSLSEEDFRKHLSQNWGNTPRLDARSLRGARANQVDIGINFDVEITGNNNVVIGRRAELLLDENTRNQLVNKGYRIISSKLTNNSHTVQLYRNGQVYRIKLTTNGDEVTSDISVTKVLGNTISNNLDVELESAISKQTHRITDVTGVQKVVQDVLSISPGTRIDSVQIQRDAAGTAEFVNRTALENYVKGLGGTVINSGERNITYEYGGDTMRLDLQANGDVIVSVNNRFLGSYQFNGSDLGNGVQRAIYEMTNDLTSFTRFSAEDVYEKLGYRRKDVGPTKAKRRNVLFIKDNKNGDYYVVRVSGSGSVEMEMVPPDQNGFFGRLEALEKMRTIEDVQNVYQDQFRSGYVEVVTLTDNNGDVVDAGMRSRTTGGVTENINDVTILTSDEVGDIINSSRGSADEVTLANFVKIVGISQYVHSGSTTSGNIVDWTFIRDADEVSGFIERAKGYGAIIADFDNGGTNISRKGVTWNAPGSFSADAAGLGLLDIYGEDFRVFQPDAYIDSLGSLTDTREASAKLREDINNVGKAVRKAYREMIKILDNDSRVNYIDPTYNNYVMKSDIDTLFTEYNRVYWQDARTVPNLKIKARAIRRHFYRMRFLQAKLHIDSMLRNNLNFANRVLIDSEINKIKPYDPNWTNDEIRAATAEAEGLALRLEEEFLSLREIQDNNSLAREIWNSIYLDNNSVRHGAFIDRIHDQGRDFRFSRDVNASPAQRNISIIDELSNHPFLGSSAFSDLIESGKLIILTTQQEIEDALLRERGYTPTFSEIGNIQGFASNDNQRIYLSQMGIKQGDAFRVLLHEFGVHMKYLGFTQAQFREILAGIKENATAQTPEGRWIRLAIAKVENTNMRRTDPYFWEEVAAYLVEYSNEYAGLGVLDRMQAWVKRWLFTNGYIDATNFHYQDFTIFSLGMLKDSRIPFRLANGKFDYTKHGKSIYDAREFVNDYITDDLVNELGYSREELRELMAAHLVGTYKNVRAFGDLPDEGEFASRFPGMDAAWRNARLRLSINAEIEAEVQRQYNEVRERYQGTDEWLKVRDKKTGELVASNLDERRWIHVRTQFFRDWFGDWENDPQNASKVVDEHGEPLVVYHGSPVTDLTSFLNQSEIEGSVRGFRQTGNAGIYFSPNRSYAERYTSTDLTREESGGRVYEMFLNIRNPATLRETGLRNVDKINREDEQRILNEGYDGIMHEHRKRPEYVIFNTLQARSATENVGIYGATGNINFRYSIASEIETALDERINTDFIPQGMQKEAGVRYPNMGEEISNFRYSIGKKAREEYRTQLERGREDLSPDEIENILKELDKYHDAKQFKKVKAALHWAITGRIVLPEDEYKVDEAIKLAEDKGIDLISNLKKYESPLDFINEYLASRPEGAPIRPKQLEERFPGIFTNFEDHGNGIVSYQVQDTKEGQQATREIINTHLGKDQSPWCLLYADARGELKEEAWDWWGRYVGLPKRVAFKNGNLISFMGTSKLPLVANEAIIMQVERVLEYPVNYSRGVSDYIDGLKNIVRDRLLLLKLKSHITNKNTLPIFDFISNYELYGSLFGFLPEEKTLELKKEVEEAIKNRTRYLDLSLSEDRTAWNTAINKFISYLDNTKVEYTFKAREFLLENREDLYKIKKQNDGVIVVDILGKGLNFEGLTPVIENEIFLPTIFYFDKKYSNYVLQPSEQWWDIDDKSHPNLDWARDPSVGRLRYSLRPYNRSENRAELRRAIDELEQVSLPETIVFEPEGKDREWIDYGTYTNRYYDNYSEEWVDESYDLRFYAPTEDTIPRLLRENFGVRFVRDVEEADLIQAQYEKAMSRQSDYIGNLWRHLLSRNGILYENGGSYLAGRALGNAFMISHFAPKNLKDGARMMKEIANGHMGVIAAVPPYQGSMLEKVGFRMIGQIPQIFRGELVLKNVYVNRAISDQDIQYAYDEYADGMTPEQLNALIENAKIISGRRESGNSPVRFSRATTTFEQEVALPEETIRYSRVTDPDILKRLESERTVKAYRMVYKHVENGKVRYYPPMNTRSTLDERGRRVFGNPIVLGEWEQSDIPPLDMIASSWDSEGNFIPKMALVKEGTSSPVYALYNPYIHTSLTPLNDQFSAAWRRNLVTLEVEIPESEITNPYWIEGAADPTGERVWTEGPVSAALSNVAEERRKTDPNYEDTVSRRVVLTRYDKPIRELSDAEVANLIAPSLVENDVAFPASNLTPSLRKELQARGVKIGPPVAGAVTRAFMRQNPDFIPDVGKLRYSIAQQPTTVEQGTAIANAPGMYKMRDGSIQVHPEEIPPGLETETTIYAAVVLSEPAKNDPGIVDLREMIAANEVLREQVLAELSARGIEDNPDNELLYGIRNILQTRSPEDPAYQAIVDVFHNVVTKATGGVQDDILLTDSDIASAAHAITNTPFEPLIGEPVPTTPTPKETVFERIERDYRMIEDRHREIVENLIEIDENTGRVRFSIAGCDVFLDGDFRDTATNTNKQELYAELEHIHGTTHQYGEVDGFYNQLASAQVTGTQEVHDYGALAQPADTNRAIVEEFIRRLNPAIYNKIQIEWTNTPDANTNLAGGLASFNPVGTATDKLIYIRGWGRTTGQVIRSAAWEASRFGWNSGIIKNLAPALEQFYDLHESAIYQELTPYYTKYNITRGSVDLAHKVFLVQSYFAKMNQDILTGNPNALANAIGIDPTTYKRIHDEIQNNVNIAVTDITDYINQSGNIQTNPEIAKAFAQDILRIVMGGMNGRGANFVYKAMGRGVSDIIYCYTNDFGLHRKPALPDDEENRHAHVAREIKENIKWWHDTFEPFGLGKLAESFCKFFLRNFPMHNGLSFLHLNVPHARLGDTTITKATTLISRIWQRIDDPHGIEIRRNIGVMEELHAILRDHKYDARWTQNATGGYENLFKSLGINDEKSLTTAKLADQALPGMLAMIRENAGMIRQEFAITIDSLIKYMTAGGVPTHEIDRAVERMNAYAESFIDDYEHRTYEVFTLDGLDELIAMQHDINIDPSTGEMGIYAKVAQARKFISDTERRLGSRNSEFYEQTEDARKIVRRLERLESLRKYKEGKLLESKSPLRGAELQEQVLRQMKEEIAARINDLQNLKGEGVGSYKKFNYIPGTKRRKLDERLELDREYMNFLGRIEDPLLNAIYSIDQQRKIIEKIFFNRELGEHILSTGMGTISGSIVSTPIGEGTVGDLSRMENGTLLQYVNVDPLFLKEINNEYVLNSKVRDSILGGVIDVWKANNTIYSIKLGINNYVGNFSMLLASGHLWRYTNWITAGQVTKRQFFERFTDDLEDMDQFATKIYDEMRKNRVVGGTMSEMNVMTYGKGQHEKLLSFFLRQLRDASVLSNQGTFNAEKWVNNILEKMKLTYAFGDEWVKPLIYLNNRANAIAKYESKINPNDPRFENLDEWRQEVERLAVEEASEQTIRETVSWENSPQFIRALSQNNLRLFTPDFLMHNFQMLRIIASNFTRLVGCMRELSELQMNNERDVKYRDALVKEIAQRGIGGAMTATTYAMLMGATGSVMALVPYMFNVLFKSMEGEDGDDDKEGMFFDPQEWEGAQRLMNYKTGGNNLFVPVFRKNGKIYAWNYVRSSVMLTHAPVRPPTDDPDFIDYGVVMFKNLVDLSNGTMTQQLINNMMGRDRWGREIGTLAGWGQVIERTMVPGFVRQLAGATLGYPVTDNLYHQDRLIKVPDLLGVTVNEYDPRDIANQLAFDITAHNSNSKNLARRNFMERLVKGDRLTDRQIASMITDMRAKNAEEFAKANYVLTGLRQVGMKDNEIIRYLTVSRKTGGDALGRKQAVDFLKGKEIYDYALVVSLVNRRKDLITEGKKLRMSNEELNAAIGNLDKAIIMYKKSLRQ